jgi:hypothetical protein
MIKEVEQAARPDRAAARQDEFTEEGEDQKLCANRWLDHRHHSDLRVMQKHRRL